MISEDLAQRSEAGTRMQGDPPPASAGVGTLIARERSTGPGAGRVCGFWELWQGSEQGEKLAILGVMAAVVGALVWLAMRSGPEPVDGETEPDFEHERERKRMERGADDDDSRSLR